ncbi:BMP family ABC transporter substrate-binding protein [Halosegnis longus]|uniref:BMP family ABC transporter substrate-binding protein n=1 Tax=Halosegnis longus TaxID=2216012 RepID=A0AAJ4UWV5_9EURY|nr:BMP family ABC transporter substrate-binding protein [Salella cibi]
MGRRQFITAAGVTGIAGLAGCSGGPSSDTTATDADGDDSDGEETDTDGGANAATNVGIVYATGGLGDGSFNDQAQQGLQQAESEFDLQTNSLQPQEVSEFGSLQQQFASSTDPSYDLISCIGFLQADALGETATQYPDKDFQIVDSVPTNDSDEQYDNVASYTFREHEGSYLAGTMAGLLTLNSFSAGAGETQSDSTNLGFVGGVESSLIQKFEAGFVAGANAVNTDIDVQTNYTGSFNDPSAGREAASSMYSSGSDIVFHASGNTGTGVFQAAQEAGKFAIGVDRDQSVTRESYADVILASMVKRVDTAVYSAVEAKVNDNFETGSTTTLGLDDDGVELVLGQQLGSELPDNVVTEVESTRQAIIDGEIDVPSDPSNV